MKWLELPDRLSWKEKVCVLSYQSLQQLDQVECPVAHIFLKEMYVREQRLPAGALITGREHIHGHRLDLIEGEAMLFAPDGQKKFTAFASIHTKPGFHAVAYTLTPVVARTYHPNPDELRNVEDLENAWFGPAEPMIEQGRVLSQGLLT
jgi:hypothetical protein